MAFASSAGAQRVSAAAVAAVGAGLAGLSAQIGATPPAGRRRRVVGGSAVVLEVVPEARGPLRNGKEILQVHVLHRHGARTPLVLFPGMPRPSEDKWLETWGQCRQPPAEMASQSVAASGGGASLSGEGAHAPSRAESTYGPCGYGQLTRLGESQLEQLGAFMRFEYLEVSAGSALLTGPCGGDSLKVVSTRTSRTILSAQSLLKGLFPQAPKRILQDLIHIDAPAETRLIANFERCDRLRQLAAQERHKFDNGLLSKSTLLRLAATLGSSTDQMSLVEAGDPLRGLWGHSLPLPAGCSMELMEDLDACGHEIVDVSVGRYSTEMRRLSMGLLLTEMSEQIAAAAQGKPTALKCIIRSAHDISVCGLLVALGLPVHHWPAFGSSVIVELLRIQQSGCFQVRVACFDGTPGAGGAPMVEVTVPLEIWEKTVAPLILTPSEYKVECRLPEGVPHPPEHRW